MIKSKIKVGIWGLGRAGLNMHCPELLNFPELFEITAGCDILPERGPLILRRCPQAHFYTDSASFLADPEVELVAIAVFSKLHVDFALRALNAGKIVFLEKPIATSFAELDSLKQAAKRFPGRLFFRQNRRFEPCFNHVREIISSGILGDIFSIRLCRQSFQFRDDWQTLTEFAGGQLNNWGPHLVDHALILLESKPVEIRSSLRRIAALGDAEDYVRLFFIGENRRLLDVEISGGTALPLPVYAVSGSRGSLISNDETSLHLKYLAPDFPCPSSPAHRNPPLPDTPFFNPALNPVWIEKTLPVHPSNGESMDRCYEYLYLSIRSGKPFPVTAEQAFTVMETILNIHSANYR